VSGQTFKKRPLFIHLELNMTQAIVEIVTFKLAANTSDQELLNTHSGIASFLQKQDGFIYRSLSKDESQEQWVDIVYWQDLSSAKAASDALMQDPEGMKMVALCDMDSVVMKHLPVLSEAMSATCESAA